MIREFSKAVPADIVAAVAGIGFSDVVRVIYAIHFIAKHTSVIESDLLNVTRLPTTSALPKGSASLGEDSDRAIDDSLLASLAKVIAADDADMRRILRLHRFD